jgi:hypothetical protein
MPVALDETLTQLLAPGAVHGIGADLWSALCIRCHSEGVTTQQDLRRTTRRIEAEYRLQTRERTMPTKYRSAKSVLKKAIAYDVAYVDAHGRPRRKTKVYAECE